MVVYVLFLDKAISSSSHRHFVGQCMALPKREFSSSEIKSSRYTCIRYSKQQTLPTGTAAEFEWKDYCPSVFRNLQELGNIDYDDYLLGVCCYETLMEIFLRGKNSRPFFLPTNSRFVIKILHKYEVKILKDMLPSYFSHVSSNQKTLLTRFYGLHSARPVLGGQKIYFVVMENLLKSEFNIHKRYDLKGTSKGRTNSKTITYQRITLKDLEFDLCFYVDASIRSQLLEQIKNDCKFLEEQRVMDYSLLLGIHIIPRRDLFNLRQYIKQHGGLGLHGSAKSGSSEDSGSNTFGEITEIPPEIRHKRDPTLADFFESADRPTTSRGNSTSEGPGYRFGANLPARALKGECSTPTTTTTTTGSSGERSQLQESREVLLYFGIIDFLQGYTMKKKIEHAYKALQFSSKLIPSVKPKVYSARFQEFLAGVFQTEDDENSLLQG